MKPGKIAYWCAKCRAFCKGKRCPQCKGVAKPAGRFVI